MARNLIGTDSALFDATERIRELEAEVRHLKAELAKRPDPVIDPIHWDTAVDTRGMKVVGPTERFNTQPFRGPIPKARK